MPILRPALSSDSLPEQQLYDLGNNFIRTRLATVQGAAVPLPYGGKVRRDGGPRHARCRRAACRRSTWSMPSTPRTWCCRGTAKIGALEYHVDLNGSPGTVAALNDLPVRSGPGGVVYVRDVARCATATPQPTWYGATASAPPCSRSRRAAMPRPRPSSRRSRPCCRASPPGCRPLRVQPVSDQSVFVTAAVHGVLHEAPVAACLTACMILLFLGSWRATLIIAVSIPLSVLASLMALSALGQTLNIMTLGGLALAVGVLVDDATVAIENITHHRELGKPLEAAILEGSAQIALPTPGLHAGHLHRVPADVPAERGGALPVRADGRSGGVRHGGLLFLLAHAGADAGALPAAGRGQRAGTRPAAPLRRAAGALRGGLLRAARRYAGWLGHALRRPRRRRAVLGRLPGLAGAAARLGRDFFPAVDGSEIRLHMRARTGTRIEETARLADAVEGRIRAAIGPAQVAGILDNIGLPVSGINLTYDSALPIGSADAEIWSRSSPAPPPRTKARASPRCCRPPSRHQLLFPAGGHHQPDPQLRPAGPDRHPGRGRQAGGQPGAGRQARRPPARRARPVDVHLQQPDDQPALTVQVDRTRALQAGLSQREVAQNLLISLSGSSQTTPNFWLNPRNGVSYPLMVSVPQYAMGSLQALDNIRSAPASPA